MINSNVYKYDKDLPDNHCDKRKIEVIGEFSLKVSPDMAIISVGVITEDKNLEKAQGENAKINRIIIRGLQNMSIDKKDISTVAYNIEPLYDYIEGKRVFDTYRVSNILNVNISDMKKIGQIIDESVKNGANNIKDITFTVSDPERFYNKALRLAVKNAVEKAMIIGNTLNVKIDKIPCSIEEKNVEFINNVFSLKGLGETEIIPGNVKINANVNGVFAY